MLRTLKWIAGATSLFLLVAMIFGTVFISVPVNAQDHKDCIAYAKANHRSDNTCKDEETLWERGLSDPVAYETMWLALFTWALASVGTIGGILTYEQISLARDEFNATHRPRLFVQAVSISKGATRTHPVSMPDNTVPARVQIRVVNGGEAPLLVDEWQCRIYYQAPNAAFTPEIHTQAVYAGMTEWLVPAQFGTLEPQQPPVDLEWDQFVNEGGRMFVIGRIFYIGKDAIRRVTGFCREYIADDGMYHALKDSEHEYSY